MLFAPTSPIIYKVYFLIIYKVRMRIGIRVCKISIKIPQTINFNVFCKLLHSAFEPKAVEVVPPCRVQPVASSSGMKSVTCSVISPDTGLHTILIST